MQKTLKTNVTVNIIRTLVLTILSFITFPWVCRYLESSALGAYTWANTFVFYFLILAKIGIPNLAIRECVKHKDDKEKLSNIVQSLFLLQLITTLISFALMTGLIFAVPALRESKELIFILSINFVAGAFSFEWVFIALEKQFYMSVRTIVVLCITAILVVVFVNNPSDLYIYAAITVGVTVLTTIANLFYIGKFVSFKKTMPYSYKQYVKPLAVLFGISLVIALYNQTDTFILGFIDESKKEVGSYSIGTKAIDIIIGIFTALSTVYIPRATDLFKEEDKTKYIDLNKFSMNVALFIILPAIATMMILANPICSLISGNYDGDPKLGYTSSPYILMTLAFMMLTYSVGEMIYGQILLPQKKEKYYLLALGSGTALNIGLSLLFGLVVFKNSPALGVSIGTLITDVLVLSYLLFISWKWIKPAIFNKNNLKLLIGALIVVGLTFALKQPMYQLGLLFNGGVAVAMVVQLVFIVLLDGIIYVLFLYFVKENIISSIFRRNHKSGQAPVAK